ncbi:GNAT family N-acetyltransferase [Thalassococcus sp. CAU 1522]|uniref:GNAT family N-acetyltransferase n=2 Tax=Thalassococcus arenae TaxID=2851652 RepID=A0ABS6N881_9RHOB|nr:GNAT family N-acetyltransferase [Thalassococcus arenae]
MRATSPAESCHVMTSLELRASGARVFALRDETGSVQAVGALKPLSGDAVELKSMHTLSEARGRGFGRTILDRLLGEARSMGARRVFLETGSAPPFAAARALYERAGFALVPPFGDYVEDPLSVFMARDL